MRPDMRDYFRGRIDWHVNGMLAKSNPRLPAGVVRVIGDVTDADISVVTSDGYTYSYTGGRYSSHKANGCYSPLMPRRARNESV